MAWILSSNNLRTVAYNSELLIHVYRSSGQKNTWTYLMEDWGHPYVSAHWCDTGHLDQWAPTILWCTPRRFLVHHFDWQLSSPSTHEQTCSALTVAGDSWRASGTFLKRLTATYPAMYRTALHSICVSDLTAVVGAVSWLCFFAHTLFRIFFKSQSKSCSVSCGSWHGSGSCFPMKLLQVSLICWLQRNWWKADHREAWADEDSLCESPETRQSFSSQTRAVAMSTILSCSTASVASSITPTLHPLGERTMISSRFSSEIQASKNSVYPGSQEALHRHPCH